MRKDVVDKVKNLFGSGFKKRVKEAESSKELLNELRSKHDTVLKKIKHSTSISERKLLKKKLAVLDKQIEKLEDRLNED